MTAHLKLRLHISEPWNFAGMAGIEELAGWTVDHVHEPEAEPNEEWEMTLDEGFDYHERRIRRLLLSPRYVGEHLSRVFDAVVGFPVRVAHRQDGGWHYALAGTLSIRHDDEDGRDTEKAD